MTVIRETLGFNLVGEYTRKRIENNCSKNIQELAQRGPEEDGSWDKLYVWRLKQVIVDQEILLNFYKYHHDERILRQADPKECICKKDDEAQE